MRKALITGITGQDGSYLAEFLLKKGYEVIGLVKRNSNYRTDNIDHIKNRLILVYGDLENEHHLCSVIHEFKPDEIYNLAAQSDVRISYDIPEYTADVTGLGVLRLLEAVRKFNPESKVYQASTSEMFGNAPAPQSESSLMIPNSPYAAAKLFAHNLCKIYRDGYNLFVSCGILFNHESERRGLNFVTRKICNNVAKIKKGEIDRFSMGNLSSIRDWGYAPEYVEAMWLMLQRPTSDDFVIGTGEIHTVEEFLAEAFSYIGIENWSDYVIIDKRLLRAKETGFLQADPEKAKNVLGWEAKTKCKDLVKIMMHHELNG